MNVVPDLVAARFERQLLGAEQAGDVAAVAERLLAVQAQDLRSARLAVRARTRATSVADFDRALSTDRSLVIGWLNRGTLHLVRAEDYWWLHELTTPPLFTGNARRLAQTGVTGRAAEKGVATLERALSTEGPLTRDALRDRLAAARVPTAGQALVHVLMLACLRGVAVRGPVVAGRHAYALARDWLPSKRPAARDRALVELARRYLAAHAPADDRDLAKWAGLPLRDARAGLRGIDSRLVHRADGLLELAGDERRGVPRPCLLDQWDPVLVGWRSRDPLLVDYPRFDDAAAHFRPFAYVAGRAVATWGLRNGHVELDPLFARVSRSAAQQLRRDADDVERFLSNVAPG
ncbi:MAG: winged helix DNA-binding domain-containing protein [Gaiellaceae bacterium]